MKRRILLGIGAGVWCLLLAFVLAYDRLLSTSVDLAHHLQLVEAFRDWARLPPAAAGYLMEMYAYPHLSHRLAALMVTLGLPSLRALTVVGCAAAGVAWLLLLDQARRVSPLVLLAGAALSLLNAVTLMALWGVELVSNFFFPQMAAEAVCMIGLVCGAALLSRSRASFLAFAVLAVWVCGGFHLLPTLKLAGALMILLALVMAKDFLAHRRVDLKSLAGLAAIPAAVVLHPAFLVLRDTAANNGGVDFGAPISLAGLALASILLLLLGGSVLALDLRRSIQSPVADDGSAASLRLIAALSVATGTMALLQLAALRFLAEGSPYAVLKYAFGVFTLLGVMAPAFVWRLSRRFKAGRGGPPRRFDILLLAGAHVAVMAAVFLRPGVLDVGSAGRTLEAVRKIRIAQAYPPGRPAAVFVSERRNPTIAYAANVAMLRATRDENLLNILYGHGPVRPEKIPAFLTEVGDPVYDVQACRLAPPTGRLVTVKPGCLPSRSLTFTPGSEALSRLVQGWAQPDVGGVWTVGERAELDLRPSDLPPGARRVRLQIVTSAFLPDRSPSRTVHVSLNGGEQVGFTFNRDETYTHVFAPVATEADVAQGRLRITFTVDDPVSPKDAGLGDDPRRLGVALEKIRVTPAP